MMDYIYTYILVVLIFAVLIKVGRNGFVKPTEAFIVFKYSNMVRYLFPIVVIFLLLMFVLEKTGVLGSKFDKLTLIELAGMVLLLGVFSICGIFFYYTRIYITKNSIIKKTPFWTSVLPYQEIKKIVIYHSAGNPTAAMTRIFGKKRITIEIFLTGYDELILELEDRCKYAEIIEKHK